MPKLTIDGMEVEVVAGTSILQAAEQLGIEVPRFCYHDKLSVPANCRMCLVEVEGGPPKPVASCAMACGEGMVVHTNSEKVKKARQGVMEFLLINHPLDCPICDQGGECDLQDQAVAYGYDRSRYYENKRAVPDKELGPLVETVMTRCINCTRCVRFSEEIAGIDTIGQLNRGEDAEIGTFVDKLVATELSGNLVDVCPVGALTSKPYEYKARPWELKKTETIDVMDAVGSNIRVDARGGEVMRIQPRLHEGINEEWIDDKTRYSYDGLKARRLDRPYVRDAESGQLREGSWTEAFLLIRDRLKGADPKRIGAMAGDLADVESMLALKDLMAAYGSRNVDCRTDGSQFVPKVRGDYLFNSGIAALEEADAILIIGCNPRTEAAMVNARIRKAWLNSRVPVGVIGEELELNYPYDHLGTDASVLVSMKTARSAFAKKLKAAKKPVFILGSHVLTRDDWEPFYGLCRELAEKYGVIKKTWNGFNVLHRAASRVGGLDIGFYPEVKSAKGVEDMCKASKDGKLDVLYLLGVDEEAIIDKLGRETFVIYQGSHGDFGAMRADVILPGSAYTEKDALYVNTEGRVQMARRAVFPVGDAREDWRIIRALSESCGETLPYDTLAQLRQRLVEEFPHFSQIDALPEESMSSKWDVSPDLDGTSMLSTPVKDFYRTNAIARASRVMYDCSRAFVGSDYHIAEAAE